MTSRSGRICFGSLATSCEQQAGADHRQDYGAEEELGPMLTPGEPDHDDTSARAWAKVGGGSAVAFGWPK
jgi:hypothetical protein